MDLHKQLYVAMVAQVPPYQNRDYSALAREALIASDRYDEFIVELAKADAEEARDAREARDVREACEESRFEWKEQFDKKENIS